MDIYIDHIHAAAVTLVRDGGQLVCPQCGLRLPFIPGRVIHACARPREMERTVVPITLEEGALPCHSRSGPPELRECRPCRAGGRTPLVWTCAIHGRCSLGAFGFKGVTSCLTCQERTP